MNVKGKSAIVTGGASGLGLGIARRLMAEGARVVVADMVRGENDLGTATFVECNVTDAASVQQAVDAAVGLAPLGVLVCCAGIGGAVKILGREAPMDLASYSQTIQVNLIGTFNCLRLAAWAMKDNVPGEHGERGVVVMTASIAAYEGQIGQAAYASSKGGVVGLTLPAARELARHGIRVMTVAPGIFDTPMLAKVPEAARKGLAEGVPFPKRLGAPEELAELTMQIVGNQMLNGSVIRIDGALRMV